MKRTLIVGNRWIVQDAKSFDLMLCLVCLQSSEMMHVNHRGHRLCEKHKDETVMVMDNQGSVEGHAF